MPLPVFTSPVITNMPPLLEVTLALIASDTELDVLESEEGASALLSSSSPA
jgi:hypothetical protein